MIAPVSLSSMDGSRSPQIIVRRPKRGTVPSASPRAVKAFGEDVNQRIIALRLARRMSFAALSREVGCSENYAKGVIARATETILVFSCGKPS